MLFLKILLSMDFGNFFYFSIFSLIFSTFHPNPHYTPAGTSQHTGVSRHTGRKSLA
jgi:hypothetical protein